MHFFRWKILVIYLTSKATFGVLRIYLVPTSKKWWAVVDWNCTLSCIKITTQNIKFFICWLSSCYRYTKDEILSDQRSHDLSLQILHGEGESPKALFNVDSTSITRGNRVKLKKPFIKDKLCKHFFSIWVLNDWNSFTHGIVNAVSLFVLKYN